ncbi:tyrosine-type recombinase/integrase [Pseudooceanicola sp.]|uniref:tyrosine-type recombinase/integrase n=1 Tax=Pseudooceanicola sp. TaxID=1914328 RepID=UPI004058F52C
MASFEKQKDGRWRVFVARTGVRRSKILPTKQAAKDWAARQEYLILNETPDKIGAVLFSEVLNRYANEVSPKKRGERWELMRLKRFRGHAIASKSIGDLSASDFAGWRDSRLREVAPGTVSREMTLLSGVLTVARKEWGLIDANPIADVRKPSSPPPRDRLATSDELSRLALSAGADLGNATARAFHAFLFAIETAMRAGEIVGLEWSRVDLSQRVCKLPKTKNGTARDVPLTVEAVRLLECLPGTDPVFGLTSRQLDVLWRKLRDRAAVTDLTFHDSRHT